jgi:hypothetical protein
MSESRNPSRVALMVMGVAWLAFAALDFYDASERGGLTASNIRFIRAIVALVLAVGAFASSQYARRPRA